MNPNRYKFIVYIFVVLAALLGAASFLRERILVTPTSRFYCELQADTKRGGEVWTVMYRHDKGRKPWLKMISTLGSKGEDEWPPQRRCEEIASRLEGFRQDRLIALTYRNDPATPDQYVICAKTKNSSEDCPLLVTLKPGADPDRAMQEMTEALIPESDTTARYQKSGSSASARVDPPGPLVVNLETQLVDEDRRSGSTK